MLDPPRLLKNKADPSALALRFGLGLARPVARLDGNAADDDDDDDDDDAEPLQPAPLPTATSGEEAEPPAEEPLPHEMTSEEQAYETALAHGVRLFSLYIGAGGALCLRHAVWRRLMLALHPDRGGHTRVFQVLSELKQRVDSGEEVRLPRTVPPARAAEWGGGQSDVEMLYAKIRAELEASAAHAGELAISRLREALQ